MARGINKAILVGNVGDDPEVRYMPSGSAVANLSLATSEQWKDKQGEKQERTEWHKVVFFGKPAEIIGEYVRKGRQLYVEGSIRTEKWTDKDGVDRYTTKIIANEFQLLGGVGQKPESNSEPQNDQDPLPDNLNAAGGTDFDDGLPF